MNGSPRRVRGALALAAALGCLLAARPGMTQTLNGCIVVMLNRTAPLDANGRFVFPNIPSARGSIRARVICQEGPLTRLGQTKAVLPRFDAPTQMGPIFFDQAVIIPVSLDVTSPTITFTQVNATAQLTVTGHLLDGSTQDLTGASTGTTYVSSNPTIATVTDGGLVTALTSGTVFITARNEGVVGALRLQVTLGNDTDGDGIPDDYEMANAVNPGGDDLARRVGVTVVASSSSGGFGPTRVIDGKLGTSWFTASGDAANRGGSPFIEVRFPSDVNVAQLRIFGNRERGVGFSFFTGIITAFDASNTKIFDSGPVLLPPPNRDATVPIDVDGIRRVRFTGTDDEGNTPGLSELEVISRPGGAGLDKNNPADAAQDFDGDGLTNLQEFQLGTSIFLADTDLDGLSDSAEVTAGTDPLNPDTDHDGLTDGDEVARGTNPLNPDSDGDGLPDGVEVRLGLNPLRTDSNNNNTPDGSEDTDGDGISNINELELQLDPGNPDTDGDGINDGEEVIPGADGFITDPRNPDTDGDGLSDGFEVRSGCLNPTDPNDIFQDQDHDGVSTLDEIIAGTNPCNLIVVTVTPPNGATNVAVNSSVVVNFLVPLNSATVNTGNFGLFAGSQPLNVTLQRSADNRSITMTATLQPGVLHTIVVNGSITDTFGNTLVGTFRSTFTTSNGADTQGPQVAYVRPPNGATGVPVDHDVSLFFTEQVDPATLVAGTHLKTSGGVDVAHTTTAVAGNGAVVLVPSAPLSPGTQYLVSVDSALKDVAGNGAQGFGSSFVTAPAPATNPPSIVAMSPPNGITGVPLNARARVSFSELVNAQTVTPSSVTIRDCSSTCNPIPGTVTLDATGTVATFVPSANLVADRDYDLLVTQAVQDVAGNPLLSQGRTVFHTGAAADTTAPQLGVTNPAASANNVPLNTSIRARFSEPLDPVTVTADSFKVTDASGAVVPCTIFLSADDRTVTFTPMNPLAPSATHTLTIGTAITDLAGNAVQSAPIGISFTTGTVDDVASPTVTRTSPVDGAGNVASNTVMQFEFSEPLDPLTVDASAVRLLEEDTSTQIPGTVALDSTNRVLTFMPSRPLFVGVRHEFRVFSTVTDMAGNRLVNGSFVSDFAISFVVGFAADTTAPTLVQASPPDGATSVPVNTPVMAQYSEAIDPVSVTAATFQVTDNVGPVPGTFQVSGSLVTFFPATPFSPSAPITVQLGGAVRDVAGNPVGTPFTFSFMTGSQIDLTGPQVITVSPPNGLGGVPLVPVIEVRFSEPVDPLTIRRDTVLLRQNSPFRSLPLSLQLDATGTVLRVSPTVPLAAFEGHEFRVTSGVTDPSGNNLVNGSFIGDFAIGFTTGGAVDATPPTVITVSPFGGQAFVPVNARVFVTFSERVALVTATPLRLATTGGIPVAASVVLDDAGTTATLTPAAKLDSGVEYEVTISDIRDLAGNLLTPITSRFTTSAGGLTDTINPTVSSVVPASGATGVAVNATVQVCFSEGVSPSTVNGGTFLLTQNNNGVAVSGSISLNGTNTCATLTPALPLIANTSYGVRVTAGVRDVAGNQLSQGSFVGDFTSSFTTGAATDTTPPHVVAVSPLDGATGVDTHAPVVIVFSEAVDPSTLNSDTLSVFAADQEIGVSINRSADSTVVTLSATFAPGVRHTLFVTPGVRDLAGNPAVPFESAFVIGPIDTTAPSVAAVRPPDGATDVPIDHDVTLFFTEPLAPATVAPNVLLSSNGTLVAETTTIGANGDSVDLRPTAPLARGVRHRVFATSGVTDLAGNGLASFSSVFTTAVDPATVAPTVVAVSPENNAAGVPTNTRVAIRFSEPLDPATVVDPNVRLFDCTSGCFVVTGALSLDATGTVVTFTPTADLGASRRFLVQAFAGVHDASGTPLPFTFTSVFDTGTGRDDGVPAIDGMNPLEGDVGVAVNASVRVRFTKRMNPVSVTAASFAVRDAGGALVPCVVTLTSDDQTVSFTPMRPLAPNAAHTLTISPALTDLPGHSVAGTPLTFHFTTGTQADTVFPQVVLVNPPSEQGNVPSDAVVRLELSEPLDPTTVNGASVQLTEGDTGQQVPGTLLMEAGNRVLTFTPTRPLFAGIRHNIRLVSTVADVAGNRLANGSFVSDFNSGFTVGFATDVTPPAVMAISPPNGVANIGVNTPITVLFSEAIDPVSVTPATLTLTGPGGAVAGQLAVSGSLVTLTPNVPLDIDTAYTVTVGAAVHDLAGNPLGAPVTSTFTTIVTVDVTNPQVVFTNPVNGASGVPTNVAFEVRFSEPIAPLTFRTDTVQLFERNGTNRLIPLTLALDASGTIGRATLGAPLRNFTQHEFRISHFVTDRSGNQLTNGSFVGDLSVSFTTADVADTVAPTVVVAPSDGATGVPVNAKVVATFSEPVSFLPATPVTVTPSGGVPVAGTLQAGGTRAAFTPQTNLANDTVYTVQITGAFDGAGNALAPVATTFRTSATGQTDTTSPMVTSVVPANGATSVAASATVRACFTEAVNPQTIPGNFTLTGPNSLAIAGAVTYDAPSRCATFTPTLPLPGGLQLTVGVTTAVADLAGNALQQGGSFSGDFTSSFTVAAVVDTTGPTVVAVSPADGATGVTTGSPIVLTFSEPLNPSTVNGDTISVFAGDDEVGMNIGRSADGTTVTLTGALPPGTRETVSVTDLVKDLAGNSAVPFTSHFDVLAAFDTSGPSVAAVRPPNGATGVPVDHRVTVFFTEPVAPASIAPGLFLTRDGTLVPNTVAVASGNDAATLTPTAPMPAGTRHRFFATSDIHDPSGNALAGFSSIFTTAPDPATTAPSIVATSPTNGMQNVPLNSRATVLFSEPINRATVTASTFQVQDCSVACGALAGTIAVDATGTVATFTPSADYVTDHSLQIVVTTGVQDAGGTPLPGTFFSSFRTGGGRDSVAPSVVATSPENAATAVPVNASIRARFSEPIDPDTVTTASFAVTDAGGAIVPCAVTLSANDTVVTFTPLKTLAPTASHTLTISSAVTDLAGNALASAPVVVTFTTGDRIDAFGPVVTSTSLAGGATGVASNVFLRVQFNERVDRSTIDVTSVTLTPQGVSPVATTLSVDAAGRVLTVTPLAPLAASTLHTLRVTAAVTDVAGNPLSNGTFVADFFLTFTTGASADTTAPTVVVLSPADGATGVARNARVNALYSEAIDPVSVTSATLALAGPGGAVAGSAAVSGAFVTFIPATPLAANTSYTATLAAGIRDLAGNQVGAATTATFTTGATSDVVNPIVNAIVPVNGATAVARGTAIQVTFSEPIDPVTFRPDTVFLTKTSGAVLVAATLSLDATGTIATITPSATLDPTTQYSVTVRAAVTDRAGNRLTNGSFVSDFTSNFTTGG